MEASPHVHEARHPHGKLTACTLPKSANPSTGRWLKGRARHLACVGAISAGPRGGVGIGSWTSPHATHGFGVGLRISRR